MNTEATKENFPITWKVQKGDTFLVQIEITEDTDLVNGSNEIMASVFRGKDMGGFKINVIHLVKSKEELVNKILEKIREVVIEV